MMHLLPDQIILKIIDMTGGFSKLKHKEKFSSTLNYINSIMMLFDSNWIYYYLLKKETIVMY